MSALAEFGWTAFWAAVALLIIGGAIYIVGLVVLGLIGGAIEWVGREFPYRPTRSKDSADDAPKSN